MIIRRVRKLILLSVGATVLFAIWCDIVMVSSLRIGSRGYCTYAIYASKYSADHDVNNISDIMTHREGNLSRPIRRNFLRSVDMACHVLGWRWSIITHASALRDTYCSKYKAFYLATLIRGKGD